MKYRFRIINEVYPNKGESKKDFISRFVSATKDEYPDIKQRYAIANAYYDRRNKKKESIDEVYGYHYGDLDYAKKADRREIMGDRGTGHFGTGFYMVGTFDPDKANGYNKRACWEIDLDKYNMFKPKSNSQAYELHDALKEINRGLNTNFPTYEYLEDNVFQSLNDKYLEPSIKEVQAFYGVDEFDAEEILWNQEQFVKEDENGNVMVNEDSLKYYIEDLEDELETYGILDYLGYDREYNKLQDSIRTNNVDDFWRDLGKIKGEIKRIIERQIIRGEHLVWAIKTLSKIFGKDVSKEAEDAIYSPNQEDSRSTVFMKSLGYEGIDVTHLNKDGEGLSGLDNFGFGSVIYDLKPGTYKKIKERDNI